MSLPENELLSTRMNVVAHEAILDWLAQSYGFLLSLCAPEIQSRALVALKDKFSAARTEYENLEFIELEQGQSNIRVSLFRKTFDDCTKKVEKFLGIN